MYIYALDKKSERDLERRGEGFSLRRIAKNYYCKERKKEKKGERKVEMRRTSGFSFLFLRSVGRAGEPAVARARIGESSGPQLFPDRLRGGCRFTGGPGSLGLEYGDPAQEYPGPAQGRGRQREAAGKANQLRERSVPHL